MSRVRGSDVIDCTLSVNKDILLYMLYGPFKDFTPGESF